VRAAKVKINTTDFHGKLMEVVIQDMSGRVFFRSFFEKPKPIGVMLPEGFYSVRANFFPAIVENLLSVGLDKENICLLQDLPKGKVKISIRNKDGDFVPGKTTFFGLYPTKTPYFKPENPLETNNTHEYFKNSCFPQAESLEVELPVGTYMITHMHTLNSDGSMTIAERIKSVVAEGVDVAISADHNYLSDYPSVLKKLGLGEYIAVLIGQEVTPLDVNGEDMPEFNRFPLKKREGEPGNGALDIRFFENNTPLFKENPETAATALKGFDTSFDLLEVMNGPFFSHDKSNNSQVIGDWLHLLNRGYYFPVVGSSDSHGIDRGEPGYTRTYVYYSGEKGNKLDIWALMQAMKKGQSFVSTGPIIEFTVNKTSVPGNTVTVEKRQLNVGIKVQSAPWVSVDEVRIIVNECSLGLCG